MWRRIFNFSILLGVLNSVGCLQKLKNGILLPICDNPTFHHTFYVRNRYIINQTSSYTVTCAYEGIQNKNRNTWSEKMTFELFFSRAGY